MVSGVKIKRSKNKNFMTTNPDYPRDIWEFIAKSTERVSNTRTGALLKDVLDFQALTPRKKEKMEKECNFPKTVFPKIDPERLKPRAVSVDPDVERTMQLASRRRVFLDGAGSNGKKTGILGAHKGHFDIAATERMIEEYKKNRPKWLQPKNKEIRHEEKKKEFDRSRGISKAEQEEMLTAAVFDEARTKSERAKGLRKQFQHNLIEGKLLRVQADLALNRVFFQPERYKLSDLDGHFASKMVDPNLDIRIIESASPTKFFEMVHRRLNPTNFHPERYEDIVIGLTPEPEDHGPAQDIQKSPYLTYLRPRHKLEVRNEPSQAKTLDTKWKYGNYHPRAGDDDRWGRRTFETIDNLAERLAERKPVASLPAGLGRSVQLNATKNSHDSPWMGGGRSPISSPAAQSPSQKAPSPVVRRVESSTFITQKSSIL